jgi:cobalamin biosynthesis protein CobT
MARRILNRKDLRADFEAAERRKTEDEEVEDEEEGEEDDEEAEGEADSGEEGEEAEEGDEADEEAPVKAKKKKPVKEAKPKRVRTPKVVRQRVVWGVFNNSNQRVATYDYPKRKEADEHAARMTADKKLTFFVQPVKEPIEEKKD